MSNQGREIVKRTLGLLAATAVLAISAGAGMAQDKKTLAIVVKGLDNPFFEQINLAGLRSKVVLTVVVSEGELQSMHDRGARMSATASGKKITLSPDDESRVRSMPIGSLTLIPGVRVTEELLRKRFGNPAQVIKEANTEVFHHLYPQHALDATTSASKSEKQVLQFVSPKDYQRLVEPLLKAGGQVISR